MSKAFISAAGDAAYCCLCLLSAKKKARKSGSPVEKYVQPLPHPPILIPDSPTYKLIEPPPGYNGKHKKLGHWSWNRRPFCVKHALWYLKKRGSKDMMPRETTEE